MMKRALLIVLTLLMLTTAGCKKKAAEKAPTTEAIAATTEVTIPGLEDSIFDDVIIEAAEEEKTAKSQVPTDSSGNTPAVTEAPSELPAPGDMDFGTFKTMAPSRQRAYQESFESIDAFYDWYEAAQEAYDKEHTPIEIVDGIVDMSEFVGK